MNPYDAQLNALQMQVNELSTALMYLIRQSPTEEIWLDSAQVMRLLNISESTLYRLRKRGQIPYTRMGGLYYYPKHTLSEWITDDALNRFKR